MQTLDPIICRKARLSRDPRFDGQFFLAVTSTGIYCRPICPARPPRESNVRYYRTAAEAAHGGFRPCLRCRPESAPDSPAWQGTSTTVRRALRLIGEGALNEQSTAQLSARLGVGERYLRKLFQQQLGVSPTVVAQTRRVHFAQKLLLETSLPVSEVAYASGFGSLRRFNATSQEKFGCSPSELRRRSRRALQPGGMVLQLSYRPPYDWAGMLDFFQRHAIAGIESVDNGCYQRNLCLDGNYGQIRVRHHSRQQVLLLELDVPDPGQLMRVVARVRRMFDLDANPADIGASLGQHPLLGKLLQDCPGVRSPTHWSTFESAVRGVVGQQVSIAAARGVCSKMAQSCHNANDEAPPAPFATFPQARQLAQLTDAELPMPNSRKQTLRAVCAYFASPGEQGDEDPREALLQLRGIGPWTVAMLGMRGLGDPDVFPSGDLGLLKAAQHVCQLQSLTQKQLVSDMQICKPWRSYAANLLWRSLSQ